MIPIPVEAKLQVQTDNSCNWKCCLSCFGKKEPTTPRSSPNQSESAQKADQVFKEAQDQVRRYESTDGTLDLEFDAVHVKIKKTPDTTPVDTPRPN